MTSTPRTLEGLATTKHVQGSMPTGFDPAAHPVIARHIFGVEPFPISLASSEVVADLKFRRQCQRLHALGPRVLDELLAELGAEHGIQTVIDQKLDRYAGLDPEAHEATGGNQFWALPLHEASL